MKRGHNEISSPENGDVKAEKRSSVPPTTEKNVASSAGNGVVKVEVRAAGGVPSSTSTVPVNTTSAGALGGGDRRKCPYLDTINRNVLDFDFEKVSL